MNRIKSLHIKNFKFFQDEEPLILEGNHLLLYGENGSGKSTIYWSLYTLFEASLKQEPDEIKKYFSKKIKPKDSLVNIHAPEVAPGMDDFDSHIEVVTTDQTPICYKVSVNDVSINTNQDAKKVNYASDWINYRMILSMSSFRHSDPIDLFDMFVEQVFKYVQFSKVQITRSGKGLSITNAFEIWEQIEKGPEWVRSVNSKDPNRRIRAYKGSEPFVEFKSLVKSFNESLNKLIDYINIHAPDYFKKLGYDFDFILILEKEAGFFKGDKRYEVKPFIIRVEIPDYENVPDSVHKPHSFLNEAKLSAMAIAIRLAILSQKLKENCLKFIVLDDLLISLDMRNREKVLDLFLSPEFSDNYQLIVLTHDRAFFKMAEHKIKILEQSNWVYYEFFEQSNAGLSRPLIKRSRTYFEKAKDFFNNNHLEESANNLRKAAEAFCKRVLSRSDIITDDYTDLDLNGMLNQCNHFAFVNKLDSSVFNDLDKHRKFILNPSSHDDVDTPKFKSELKDCLDLFENYFEKVKVKHVLKVGESLHFELSDKNGKDLYRWEIELEENFKLYKEPGKDSVLIRGRMTYTLFKNGTQITKPPVIGMQVLKKLYDDPYKTSNMAKSSDYWNEIIINETGLALSTKRDF